MHRTHPAPTLKTSSTTTLLTGGMGEVPVSTTSRRRSFAAGPCAALLKLGTLRFCLNSQSWLPSQAVASTRSVCPWGKFSGKCPDARGAILLRFTPLMLATRAWKRASGCSVHCGSSIVSGKGKGLSTKGSGAGRAGGSSEGVPSLLVYLTVPVMGSGAARGTTTAAILGCFGMNLFALVMVRELSCTRVFPEHLPA